MLQDAGTLGLELDTPVLDNVGLASFIRVSTSTQLIKMVQLLS